MIYRFVLVVIVLNIIYELVEVVFPSSRMKSTVKSFVLIVVLYLIVSSLSNLI